MEEEEEEDGDVKIDASDKTLNTGDISNIVSNGRGAIATTTIDLANIDMSLVSLSVTEGKYRMVRRILHNAGHTVLELHRLEYGGVTLGDLPAVK